MAYARKCDLCGTKHYNENTYFCSETCEYKYDYKGGKSPKMTRRYPPKHMLDNQKRNKD